MPDAAECRGTAQTTADPAHFAQPAADAQPPAEPEVGLAGTKPADATDDGTALAAPDNTSPTPSSPRPASPSLMNRHPATIDPPPSPPGTPAAQLSADMSAAAKVNKASTPAEQDLPAGAVVAATFSSSAGSEEKSTAVQPDESAGVPAAAQSAILSTAAPASHTGPPLAEKPAGPRFDLIEKTQQTITEAAVHLKRMAGDSLSVVLKPDAHTELSLHLQLHGGQVETRAQLERGDFSALNAHWSQLQERLAQHGVHLAALARAPEQPRAFSHGGGFSSHHREPAPERPVMPGGPAASVSSLRPTSPSRTAAGRGWESWA